MTMFMVGGLLVSSIGTGRIISRTGRWKRYLVGGMVFVVVGLSLLSTIDESTNLVRVGAFMAVLGLGLGATMQNLVLVGAEQHRAARHGRGQLGRRVLPLDGRLDRRLGARCGAEPPGRHQVTSGLATLGVHPAAGGSSSAIPDMATLPAPVRAVFEAAFGDATGHVFLLAAPFALVALVAVLFIREVPLRTTIEREDERVSRRLSASASAGVRCCGIRTPGTGRPEPPAPADRGQTGQRHGGEQPEQPEHAEAETSHGATREPTSADATMTLSVSPSTPARVPSGTASWIVSVTALSTCTVAAPATASGSSAHPSAGVSGSTATVAASSSRPDRARARRRSPEPPQQRRRERPDPEDGGGGSVAGASAAPEVLGRPAAAPPAAPWRRS